MTDVLSTTSDLASTYDAGRAYELDRAHVFHSWSAQAEISPMVVTRGAKSLDQLRNVTIAVPGTQYVCSYT